MKILLVSSRFPWPPWTGDRLRLLIWLEALREEGELTVVGPAGALTAQERLNAEASPLKHAVWIPVQRSVGGLVSSSASALLRNLPLHSLITAGWDWTGALERADNERGPFDCTIVLLSRLDPWVSRRLRSPRRILDAIDSLALSVSQRAAAARGLARTFWSIESKRTAKLEREAASRYDRVTVVNEAEKEWFGGRATEISNGVEIHEDESPPLERQFDFGFWGRLAYFANRDAVDLLMREIWPKIRSIAPAATLLIAGAEASAGLLSLSGRDGITVISPIGDRAALLRRVRIALFPIRYGSGQSNKVLEAAEASCAIVTTRQGCRGLEMIANEAAVASENPDDFASRAAEVLGHPDRIAATGARLRRIAIEHYSRSRTEEKMRAVVRGVLA